MCSSDLAEVLALVEALVLADVLALVEALVLAEVLALVEALVLAEVLALVEALVLAEVLALVDALVLADVLAHESILEIESDNEIFSSALHPLNALTPIIGLPAIAILFNFLQFKKALLPICFNDAGVPVTVVIEWQYANA